jgi:TonB-linked SusC/RagA family outer membrane protein
MIDLNMVKGLHFLLLTVISFPFFAYAQGNDVKIKGKVLDEKTQEPIIGASISLAGAKEGTVSDLGGFFSLSVRSLPVTVSIDYLGYRKQEVDIYEATEPVIVQLSESANFLNEIVVVGYGTQRRKELTGAIATVSPAVLQNVSSTSFDGLLGGAVAGLNVTQTSGAPGAPSKIRIRGGNSINAGNEPLYVIDGFIFYADPANNRTDLSNIESELNPLASLNPSDIESIEILKDVSATAIYGSRGANGVIIVNTKKGRRGKNNISYQFYAGVEQISRKLPLLNATQWAHIQNDYDYNYFSDDAIAALGKGSDWQNAMLRTAQTQNHTVSFNGGDANTQYLVSGNYVRQQGTIINTGYERFSGRFNFDRKLVEGLLLNLAATVGKSIQNGVTTDAGNPTYKGSVSNPLRYALRNSPAVAVYNADGTYNYRNPYEKSNDLTRNGVNPNPVADMNNNTAENVNTSLLGNTYLQYTVIDGLTLKAAFGANVNNAAQSFFAPKNSLIGLLPEGKGGVGNKRYESYQQEYTVNFSRLLGEIHFINVLAGYTTQITRIRHSSSVTAKFSKEDLGVDNLYDGNQPGFPETGGTNSELKSLLTRVNYTLLERYNLTATFRADESSRFATGHRWGYFPSLGLSWNIIDNGIGNTLLKSLKLRLSAGNVGNQEIADGLYAANYTAEKSSQDGEPITVYTRARLGNADLKWETTTQYNAGVDAGFRNNRLTLAADVYYKKTTDLLYNAPLDVGTGFRYQMQNIGSVENKGVELGIDWKVVDSRDLTINASANMARNINRITDLGAVSSIKTSGSFGNVGSNEMILQVGESLGSFYGLVFDGVVQPDEDVSKLPAVSWMARQPQAGDPKYRNTNGDNRIDADDRVVLGSIQPDFTCGFFLSAVWRKWDFFASLQGSAGGKVYNQMQRELEKPDGTHNFSTALLDAYTDARPSTTVPRISREIIYAYLDSRFVEDAAYLRLKDISIGYTVPVSVNNKLPAIQLRLFASAKNLFTITPYSGYDPEVGSGVDLGVYPRSRTFLVGGSISF